ncbi:unnamed protein product [Pelagomonas calceolata]|uniref:Phosphoribosyltransferase domain-containing protein n=2 Tax=Pelagomonas calceolata TaxID=35677 RepID=A0A8J2SVJ7_9STRA|nr:unnamed protein product [Pelagomonas calceolata]
MRGAALVALLLAAEAFLQPRRPGPTTALAARKRSQRSKEKGSADHSSVDDWTGRRRRRIRDDVEAALDDPNWFGNRGEAYEAAGDDDPMAGWFDEESMVADGMGAGRARAVMARRRAIAGIGRPSASALEVEGALESFSTLAEGSPSYVYDDEEDEEDEDEEDDEDAVSEFYNAPVAAAEEDVEEIPPLVTSSRTSSPTLEAADFARPAPDTKVPGLDRRWCTAVAAGPFARYAKFFLREFGVEQALNVDDVEISDGDEEAQALERAVYVSEATGLPCVAEFTVLEVEALEAGARELLPRAAAAYRVPNVEEAQTTRLLERLATVSPGERRTRFVACCAFHDAAKNASLAARAETRCDLRSATALTAMTARTEAFQGVLQALCEDLCEDPREDKAVEDLTFEFFEARRERALAGPRPAAPGAEAFRERLRNEARVLTNGNVDVSAFVGSVVDVALLDEAAAELRRRLGPDVTDAATKILTTGVSGQQLALPLARLMSVPLVACRREAAGAGAVANAMGRGAYADALDVTYRSKHYGPGQQLYLPRDALSEDDVVLVVDDFLASGSCQEAMFRLVARAGARPAGLAVLVEKTFDGGRDFLSAWPVPVASLAAIVSVDNGYIELLEEDDSFDDVGVLDFGDAEDDTVFGLDFLPVGGDP